MRSIRSRHHVRGPERRAQGGFVTARVALALTAATCVTAAVSGPLAYQTHQARTRADQQPTATTVTSPRPNVLGSTTVREPMPPASRTAPGAPPVGAEEPAGEPGG